MLDKNQPNFKIHKVNLFESYKAFISALELYKKLKGGELGEYKKVTTYKKRGKELAGKGEYEFIPAHERVVDKKITPKPKGKVKQAVAKIESKK